MRPVHHAHPDEDEGQPVLIVGKFRILGLAVLLGLCGCGKAEESLFFDDWQDIPHLRRLLNEADYIAVGHTTACDPKTGALSLHLDRLLKGTPRVVDWKMDLSTMKLVCGHLPPGAPVVVFSNDQLAYTYGNRYFFTAYGSTFNGVWTGSQVCNYFNQSFNGRARELTEVVEGCLRGDRRPPPQCPSLPKIDDAAMRKLPAWDERGPDEYLPAPFRKGVPLVLTPRPPEKPVSTSPGLEYAVYPSYGNDFAKQTARETGILPAPEFRPTWKGSQVGVRFHGFLEIPKDGDYAFVAERDGNDSLELRIGGWTLDLAGPVLDYVPLLAGIHDITLEYSGRSGGALFELFWTGPELPKQPIPAKAWSYSR